MARPSQKLPEDVKRFMVVQFAMGMTPTQVAKATSERFNRTITKQTAFHYNPNGVDGRKMAAKWIALYHEVREKFLADVADIPIANRSYRLKQLQIHYEDMADRGAVRLATDILEKAAKEAGNVHSNESKVTHSHKGVLQIEQVSEDEIRNQVAAAIATMIESAQAQQVPQPTTH